MKYAPLESIKRGVPDSHLCVRAIALFVVQRDPRLLLSCVIYYCYYMDERKWTIRTKNSYNGRIPPICWSTSSTNIKKYHLTYLLISSSVRRCLLLWQFRKISYVSHLLIIPRSSMNMAGNIIVWTCVSLEWHVVFDLIRCSWINSLNHLSRLMKDYTVYLRTSQILRENVLNYYNLL